MLEVRFSGWFLTLLSEVYWCDNLTTSLLGDPHQSSKIQTRVLSRGLVVGRYLELPLEWEELCFGKGI